MGLLLFVSLFPFFWMLRTALSHQRRPGHRLAVAASRTTRRCSTSSRRSGLASTEELAEAGTLTSADVNFFTALRNSVIVCTLITIGQVTFCSMAAYAFARLRFPGRDKLFFLFLTAMMIPPIFTLIPNFVLIKNLGWLNTFPGIVAPFFLMTPFAVFFLRQFFLGISKEVEEAALLDGAGRWKIFRQLILPMSAAPLATLAVLTYITAWNEYMWPLVTGDSENVRVLTVALNAFKSSTPTDRAAVGAADGRHVPGGAAAASSCSSLMAKRMVDAIGFSGIK